MFYDDNSSLTRKQSNFYDEIKFPNYDDVDNYGTLIDKAEISIFSKKLDEEIPMMSSVLEVGCGTGQLSLFLSRYNRIIHAIDLSNGSLKLAEKFRKLNKIPNVYFYKMNLFNLCFRDNSFDVVISNGVLHHTHNTKLAFKSITNVLKPKGYIVIGLYHKYGRIFTNLMQFINKNITKKIQYFDTVLTQTISESKKFAWYKDQYENPHETSHSLNEVLNWFEEFNIEYLSSVPFDFKQDNKLFNKNLKPKNINLFIKEISQSVRPSQIREGGFFIVVGRKL